MSSPSKPKQPHQTIVNVYEAKTRLSELIDRAAGGEEITIAKAGRPRARLVPLPKTPRRPGSLKGKIWVAADFDRPLPPDTLRAFTGEEDEETP